MPKEVKNPLPPKGFEHTAALGNGNFQARVLPDSDESSRIGRSHVSATADAWADQNNFPGGKKFKGNAAGLTATEHEAAVAAFLAGGPDDPDPDGNSPSPRGGKITRVDQGVSSGVVLGVQKTKIRFGKSPETYKR